MVSVARKQDLRHLENIGGGSYLSALAGSVPTTANFHYYKKSVKQYYQKRKTIEIAHRIKQRAEHEDIEADLT